jgi:CBS domain-containing protein
MTIKVRDLMQVEVVALDASERLDTAERLMRTESIRHLPVLSAGRLVGILSQRDLYRAATSSLLGLQPGTEEDWLAKIPVGETMSTQVFTAHPDASLGSAAEMMVRERIGCLPVVEDDRLVGLLSETDCLRFLADLLRRPQEPS